jgi:hypothetical protein
MGVCRITLSRYSATKSRGTTDHRSGANSPLQAAGPNDGRLRVIKDH